MAGSAAAATMPMPIHFYRRNKDNDRQLKKVLEGTEVLQQLDTYRHLQVANVTPDDLSLIKSAKYFRPNSKRPKGCALVICNKQFEQPDKHILPGMAKDEISISLVLAQLGYEVDVEQDLTAEAMSHAIEDFALKGEHKNADSTVVVVLTHGDEDKLYGTDWKTVDVNEFIATLNGEKCQDLRTKPKLFVLLACRGDKEERASHTLNSIPMLFIWSWIVWIWSWIVRIFLSFFTANASINDQPLNGAQKPTASWTLYKKVLSKHANTIIAYATMRGHVAYTDLHNGSYFIKKLCKIIAQFAHCEQVNNLLEQVNHKVTSRAFNEYKQMPEISSTLTSAFYFFPGYTGQAIGEAMHEEPSTKPATSSVTNSVNTVSHNSMGNVHHSGSGDIVGKKVKNENTVTAKYNFQGKVKAEHIGDR